MIVADENIDSRLISKLRINEYEVISIKESYRGIADRRIIDLVKDKNGILITEDKDFGEWIFSHNIKDITVIFLRYKNISDLNTMEKNVLKILNDIRGKDGHRFITITNSKIRIREI